MTAIDRKGTRAYGRFQLLKGALKDSGLMDQNDNWTGKYGIHSFRQFNANKKAQIAALQDYFRAYEEDLKGKGAYDHIGQTIIGILKPFKITEAGLLAAAHRRGPTRVKQYLKHQQRSNWRSYTAGWGFWKSDFKGLEEGTTRIFKQIEKRLRTFEHVPYD